MGFNINETFPSKYMKAADLAGKTVQLNIADIQEEVVGDDSKLVVYFKGKKKGLVLNKTNANNIALVFGPDTDGWIDENIQAFPMMVDFQGRSMESIRVKAVPRQGGKKQKEEKRVNLKEDLDDDIPF